MAVVEDLGSTNGTYVDGKLVTGGETLGPGARVRIGETVIEHAVPLAATDVRPVPTSFEQQTRARDVPSPAAPAAPAERANGIEVYGLIREFKGGFRAVNQLYLQVHPGEVYGFLGPNGAGSRPPCACSPAHAGRRGHAHVAGYDMTIHPAEVRASHRSGLPESLARPDGQRVRAHRLPCAMQALGRRMEDPRRKMVERGPHEGHRPAVRGLSNGLQRRLGLALTLIHRPRVLFLR